MGSVNEESAVAIYSDAYLRNFSTQVFMHFGVPQGDAELAADVLAKSDLRGIDSHGVARLHTYFEMLELGRINPKPKIKILREKASVAAVDGDNGLGLVVGPKANEIAMDKAEQHGSGWVSVCNSNHFGIAGYYPLKALERDLIGWAMTNSTKLVAPLWGAEKMLGTNPLAIAFPGYKEPPIVIDMATSLNFSPKEKHKATLYGIKAVSPNSYAKGEEQPYGNTVYNRTNGIPATGAAR